MKKALLLAIAIVVFITANAQTKTTIYFDSNKSELKNSSVHLLDSVSAFLLTSKDYRVSINGYCDNSGNDSRNQTLSEERAGIVSTYLKKKNIPQQFIISKGFSV